MHYRMKEAVKRVMLENKDRTIRYEFYSEEVLRSNLDDTILYYELRVKRCEWLGTGSTFSIRRISVEEGNILYKMLKNSGFVVVTDRSFA